MLDSSASSAVVGYKVAWLLGMKQRQGHGGNSSRWRAVWPEYVPKQQDGCNCGVFVIANALAVAMGERDCGTIDPRQWRIWLATEAIAKGRRDRTHGHEILHTPNDEAWKAYLGRRPKHPPAALPPGSPPPSLD